MSESVPRSRFEKVSTPVFPRDVWSEIFSNELDLTDVLSLSESCTGLYNICNHNLIWKSLFWRRWPKSQLSQTTSPNDFIWKDWYKTHNRVESNLRNLDCHTRSNTFSTNWVKIVESPLGDKLYCFAATTSPPVKVIAHPISLSRNSNSLEDDSLDSIHCFDGTQRYLFMDADYEKCVFVNGTECCVLPNTPIQHGTPLNMEHATKLPLGGGIQPNAATVKSNLLAVGAERQLKLWDLNTGQLVHSIDHQGPMRVRDCSKLGWQTEDPSNQNLVALWRTGAGDSLLCLYDPRSPTMISQTETAHALHWVPRNNIVGILTARRPNLIHLLDLRFLKPSQSQHTEISSVPGREYKSLDFDSSLTRIVTVNAVGAIEFFSLHNGKKIETFPYWTWHGGTGPEKFDAPVLTCTSTHIAIANGTDMSILNLASTERPWKDFPLFNDEPLPKVRGVSNAEMFYRIAEKRQQTGTLNFDMLEILQEDSFSDLEIATKERVFKVHRCVLAGRSSVLAKILKEDKPTRLEWVEFPTSTYQKLLHWMYSGHCNVFGTLQERAVLLKLAHQLELKRLEELILETITHEKTSELLQLATELDIPPLLDFCIQIIKKLPANILTANEVQLTALLNRMSQLPLLEDKPTWSYEGISSSSDAMELTFTETSVFPATRPNETTFFIPRKGVLPTTTTTPEPVYIPVRDITPYLPKDWKIKVKVVRKSLLGFFAGLLEDDSGQIGCTSKKSKAAVRLYEAMELGSTYEISGAKISAHKSYVPPVLVNSPPNPFELVLDTANITKLGAERVQVLLFH